MEQTPQEWASDVTRLVTKAYPNLPETAREELVRENFLRGLPEGQMRIATEISRPKSLEEAVNYVVCYESVTGPSTILAPKKPKEAAPEYAIRAVKTEDSSNEMECLVAMLDRFRDQQERPTRREGQYLGGE